MSTSERVEKRSRKSLSLADKAKMIEEPDKPGFGRVNISKESRVSVGNLVENKTEFLKNY